MSQSDESLRENLRREIEKLGNVHSLDSLTDAILPIVHERIQAARLEEAKWWGDSIPDCNCYGCERIAELEAQAGGVKS